MYVEHAQKVCVSKLEFGKGEVAEKTNACIRKAGK